MSKVNRAKGNMYEWVSHTWSPMVGCPHQCSYCYVRAYRDLSVEPRIYTDFPTLGNHRTIFVGHLADMFAEVVPNRLIYKVLNHCALFDNSYVFQSKNPGRFLWLEGSLPTRSMVGTTIETNRQDILDKISKAPPVAERAEAMSQILRPKFVTIEPVMDFDVDELVRLIVQTDPNFVNIGADSKRHNLVEPSAKKVNQLIEALQENGIEIRNKANLERLTLRK